MERATTLGTLQQQSPGHPWSPASPGRAVVFEHKQPLIHLQPRQVHG
ncbi:MAG: hypothetical protein KDA77_15365 [Planctomycetaceae bacterium]|nr:hypothetical protein [Planctomycetaceae bacterium]